MAVRSIRRAASLGNQTGLPSASPIYVDSDSNEVKVVPAASGTTEKTLVDTDTAQTLTSKTLTTPVLNGTPTGTAFRDRTIKTAVTALTGAALQAAVQAWQNPEGAGIIILRALLNVTTVATGAATVDVGVTAVDATTESDTLLDGVDVNAAIALFDSMNAALDSGANAKAQTLASGKWVTVKSKTGDTTGMVANLIVQYILA